ncbi:MAG: hypothetical protein QOC71_1851, partial [Thermoplasmata archaeon]|nr:hypothetical protein [Thermoplasmata archaeon]
MPLPVVERLVVELDLLVDEAEDEVDLLVLDAELDVDETETVEDVLLVVELVAPPPVPPASRAR